MTSVRATAPIAVAAAPPVMARVSGRTSVRQWLEAALLIGGPLLVGALFYLANTPDRGRGVFVETERANYALAGYPVGTPHSLVDGGTSASVLTGGAPRALVVVGFPIPAGGPSAKLYAFVVDDADPQFQSDVVPIPSTIQRLNARAYRVTSPQLALWGPGADAFELYDRVLATHAGSRATMEALIGLEIDAGQGRPRQVYALRAGPR